MAQIKNIAAIIDENIKFSTSLSSLFISFLRNIYPATEGTT